MEDRRILKPFRHDTVTPEMAKEAVAKAVKTREFSRLCSDMRQGNDNRHEQKLPEPERGLIEQWTREWNDEPSLHLTISAIFIAVVLAFWIL